MKNRALAKRYASAMMELAVGQSLVDQVEKDLSLIASTISGSQELSTVFYGQMEPEEKQTLMTKLFEGRIEALTLKFLKFVISRRREEEVITIAEVFRDMSHSWKGIVDVEVVSSTELPEGELKDLRNKLKKMTGKDVTLSVSTDPSLLGGLKVRVGDMVMDGSVAAKLRLAKNRLQSTTV